MSSIRPSDRVFGLMFATIFAVIAGVGWLVFDATFYWAGAVSVSFLTVGLAAPGLLLPLNRIWGIIARRIAIVSNYVLLGSFFYLIIVPVGIVLRLCGRDFMQRALDGKASSWWRPVERHSTVDTFSDMF